MFMTVEVLILERFRRWLIEKSPEKEGTRTPIGHPMQVIRNWWKTVKKESKSIFLIWSIYRRRGKMYSEIGIIYYSAWIKKINRIIFLNERTNEQNGVIGNSEEEVGYGIMGVYKKFIYHINYLSCIFSDALFCRIIFTIHYNH